MPKEVVFRRQINILIMIFSINIFDEAGKSVSPAILATLLIVNLSMCDPSRKSDVLTFHRGTLCQENRIAGIDLTGLKTQRNAEHEK